MFVLIYCLEICGFHIVIQYGIVDAIFFFETVQTTQVSHEKFIHFVSDGPHNVFVRVEGFQRS